MVKNNQFYFPTAGNMQSAYGPTENEAVIFSHCRGKSPGTGDIRSLHIK